MIKKEYLDKGEDYTNTIEKKKILNKKNTNT